jgi:hypothetical protein
VSGAPVAASTSMRLFVLLSAALLGCSGSDFEVASTSDTGTSVDDSASSADVVAEDAGSDTSVVDTGTDDASVPESGTVDGGSADAIVGTTCSKTAGCKLASEYCKLAHCGDLTGTCASPGAAFAVYAPVCGCDGVTYWNASFAESFGVSVSHHDPCLGPEGMTCDFDGGCGSGGLCVRDLGVTGGTCMAPGKGRCWRKPGETDCAATVGDSGGSVSTCTGACKTRCQAVKDHSNFRDSTCTPG